MEGTSTKSPVAIWILLALIGLPMLYPLSAGPTQLYFDVVPDSWVPVWLEDGAFDPLHHAIRGGPGWVKRAFNWYIGRWDALGLWLTGRMRTPFGSPDNDADWIFDGAR